MRGYIFGGGAWVERLPVVVYAETKKIVPENPPQHDASDLSLSYKQTAATRRDFWNRIEVKAKLYALTAFWGEGSLLSYLFRDWVGLQVVTATSFSRHSAPHV